MSVIVSDSTNAAYDGNLSTVNGWYRSEAYNIASYSTTALSLGTTRTISLTFANAGTFLGAIVGISSATYGATLDRSVTIELQQNIASVWTMVDTVTLTASQLHKDTISGQLTVLRPFKFTGAVAVDTTASKWRLSISQSAGTSNWFLTTSDGTNPHYVTWCNTQVTATTTSDCIVCANDITIDGAFTTKAYTGTGDTTNGVSGIVCSDVILQWDTGAASSYSFIVDGTFTVCAFSTVRSGTSASRIPIASQAIWEFKYTPTAGTARGQFKNASGQSNYSGRSNFYFYGEVPAAFYTTLTGDAATGQKVLNVASSTGFSAGDIVVIGRENVKGAGSVVENTVASTGVGTITLTNNIAGQNRISGATVLNLSQICGCIIRSDNLTSTSYQFANGGVFRPSNLIFSGVTFVRCAFGGLAGGVTAQALEDAANHSEWLFEDCNIQLGQATISSSSTFISFVYSQPKGLRFNRVYANGTCLVGDWTKVYHSIGSNVYASGDLTITACRVLKHSSTVRENIIGIISPNSKVTITDCYAENCGFAGMEMGGTLSVYQNNFVWGGLTAGYIVNGLFDSTTNSGNYAENNTVAYQFGSMDGASVARLIPSNNSITTNDIFGSITANTNDVSFYPGIKYNFEFKSPSSSLAIDITYLKQTVYGSTMAISDDGGVANTDLIYSPYGNFQRCGDGLTDITVHTSGADKFSLRMESTDGANNNLFEWSFKTPTGNIQSQDMVVACWVKIANANYYGGTYYQLPRLTINYDDGTLAYAQAAASTAWQLLLVPFRPTTAFGQITITLSCKTDVATASQRYVYWDDFSVLYPAGYTLNLGGLDLWANAFPITPPISTSISALDVWTADPSTFGAGTVGEMVKTTSIKVDDAAIINGLTV